MYEIKCMACPEGKLIFDKPPTYKPPKYWDKIDNISKFLKKLEEHCKLKSPKDWNSISFKQIKLCGGISLLNKFSVYDIKCMGCPEGKSFFDKPIQYKPPKYWDNKENVLLFLYHLKDVYHLNSIDDWNSVTKNQIELNGGSGLFYKYSLYDLKCLGFPPGKDHYNPSPKPLGFWENEENVNQFINQLIDKFKLNSSQDWNRLSKNQIKSSGGDGLLNKNAQNCEILQSIASKTNKRSSQRWLFLQIQKLFPNEEIIEDYFHSELSRLTGVTVQFDIYLIHKNIAVEYHGKQHYEDIPSRFANVEMYQNRDREKKLLCKKNGIKLIIIPYWWDNSLDSLKAALNENLD